MRWRNSIGGYGIIAQCFHWFIAALVLTQIGIGVYVNDLPFSLERLRWMTRHKSVGILILALFVMRVVWRWLDPPPQLPSFMPLWERRAALITHWLMYALAIPAALIGWLHASAAGLGASFFGLFPIPEPIPKNAELSEVLEVVHAWLVWSLAAVLALHVTAALRHLQRRDGVFGRMLPGRHGG